MRRQRIVLYNPRAPFYTMPLALIAVGSALDRSRHDVVLLDGRLERDPVARVVAATEDADCLGISVLTGIPIRDALAVTRAVRAARPGCRIVWGGWHPSLFPVDTVRESGVDAVVVGQGEDTFAEIVARIAAGDSLYGVAGCVTRAAAEEGGLSMSPPRPTRDVNAFPEHDYGLIDVERYFTLKDIKLEQVFATAEKCRRHGVAVLFNLIVGFPDEPADSITATLAIAKKLRAFGSDFQVALFCYRPYPGTPITENLARRGHPLPRTLEDWAGIEDASATSPWIDRRKGMLIERFGFYQRIGWAKATRWRAPLQAVARWRCRGDRYAFPIEKTIVEWLRPRYAP